MRVFRVLSRRVGRNVIFRVRGVYRQYVSISNAAILPSRTTSRVNRKPFLRLFCYYFHDVTTNFTTNQYLHVSAPRQFDFGKQRIANGRRVHWTRARDLPESPWHETLLVFVDFGFEIISFRIFDHWNMHASEYPGDALQGKTFVIRAVYNIIMSVGESTVNYWSGGM